MYSQNTTHISAHNSTPEGTCTTAIARTTPHH